MKGQSPMIPRLAELPAPVAPALAFLDELRLRGFSGDLSSGAADRVVMATDNSIYQRQPQAVVFPAAPRICSASRRWRRTLASRASPSGRAAAAPAPTASR
ncbi:hypothetical protein [Teichococcus aestuarii]|uniref:hypothetical protein n=1 Tax=Teichococcus aestuarii TaxID=568898 RepID=UPI0036185B33